MSPSICGEKNEKNQRLLQWTPYEGEKGLGINNQNELLTECSLFHMTWEQN